MDTKRLLWFIVFSFSLLFLWEKYQATKIPPVVAQTPAQQAQQQAAQLAEIPKLRSAQRIKVETDVLLAEIDTVGGDLRSLKLKKHGELGDVNKPFTLLQDQGKHVYIAQTGLLGHDLPIHYTVFSSAQTHYELGNNNKLQVRLEATTPNQVKVAKIYEFNKNSYLLNVRYEINNQSAEKLTPTAYYRLVRDGESGGGDSYFVHTFTGPAVFTSQDKFQKIKFTDLDKNKAEYNQKPTDGWLAMVQHYFISAWLLNPQANDKGICRVYTCEFEVKKSDQPLIALDGLKHESVYHAMAKIHVGDIAPKTQKSFDLPLYVGPEQYSVLANEPLDTLAPDLIVTKDYGIFKVISAPLFWLLQFLHQFVANWGLAIIALTLLVKLALFPLSRAGYRSMAKVKVIAPKMQALKETYGDDRAKFQQAMLEFYKKEKINPVGGCFPILIQIPVFIGLYWVLLSSVELRQAPFYGWVHDLSIPDPLYILPALMAITMIAQSYLNPPPTDPIQARMAKLMPYIFSATFFFFPAGLVLYYLVNNLLSIAQQWYINKAIEKEGLHQK